MYLAYYGLNEKPFQISPDPKFLWLGQTHKEALLTLQYGIRDNRGLLLLVGDVGTGKTTLINALLNDLDENIIVASILDPGLKELDFYNFLANAFHIHKKFESKGDFLVHFIHFLHNAYKTGKKVLLIIDEAQRLSHDMLEEIRLLSNIGKQDEKLINIFLVGQTELNDKLAESRNRSLLQRISLSYSMNPLKKNEVGDYIHFRLRIAGTEEKLFNSGAVREIVSFSKCYPRLINNICDRALLTGFTKEKRRINASIIRECAKELQLLKAAWKPRKKRSPAGDKVRYFFMGVTERPAWEKAFAVGMVVLLMLITGVFYFSKKKTDMIREERAVQVAVKQTPPASSTPETSLEINDTAGSAHLKKETVEASPPEVIPPPPEEIRIKPPPLSKEKVIISFSIDSNEMSSETYVYLNHLVEMAHHYPDTQVVITGYTDSTGSYGYNKQLSLFRANVVKNYFVGQGIHPSRITTIGKGPENPIALNDTLEGRMANRRVEIEFK